MGYVGTVFCEEVMLVEVLVGVSFASETLMPKCLEYALPP
jgi:hypothetical protein